MVSKYAVKGMDLSKFKIQIIQVSKLEEMYQLIF
jgi:DNA repair protein RadA/Sms